MVCALGEQRGQRARGQVGEGKRTVDEVFVLGWCPVCGADCIGPGRIYLGLLPSEVLVSVTVSQ